MVTQNRPQEAKNFQSLPQAGRSDNLDLHMLGGGTSLDHTDESPKAVHVPQPTIL